MTASAPPEEFSANIAFMLRRAQEASFAAFASLTDEKGLRPGHYAVLQIIADQPGISQTALSRQVGRDKTTITPLIKDFEKRKFVSRTADPEDGRGRMVSLTPAGHRHLDALRACAASHDDRLNRIVGKDKAAFLTTLGCIISELDQSATLPPKR